ncbi:Putative cytoplasmic protein [hydrothermal vent metagenome]|uniref:Cytoplasmic protein n=1 Tax=hydrothermal vent metagenome TaxID=652676 RepID=A0A3B0Z121_9ZZZZ
MTDFTNVNITKKANVYFDGAVTSRTINFSDGSVKTLGLMQPGQYHFDTDKKELMEILQGEVDVQLAGQSKWQRYAIGDTFEIEKNSSFKITALTLTDYVCSFVG